MASKNSSDCAGVKYSIWSGFELIALRRFVIRIRADAGLRSTTFQFTAKLSARRGSIRVHNERHSIALPNAFAVTYGKLRP